MRDKVVEEETYAKAEKKAQKNASQIKVDWMQCVVDLEQLGVTEKIVVKCELTFEEGCMKQ
ncbi:Hypothetical predicted protein [Paramuricea clavata]|uniref:Uncharacterized protein n=1 Tax=Paramuricea clavata TaxID=317549 RepID=A0A6S7ICS3_PARCT|nr:Hypothetical predicted protein [Paramuricea clavata]